MPEIVDRSPPALVDALCRRIEKLLVSYWPLPEEQEFSDVEPSPPRVHAQYLPVSKTESKERNPSKDWPMVQVVCLSGAITDFKDEVNGSEIIIHIQFGGYNDDENRQGWRIPTGMLWRVLQDLLANTILQGYQLTAPIKWSPLNSREPPYYTAQLETAWKGGPPAVEVPDEGNLYGGENEMTADPNSKTNAGEG